MPIVIECKESMYKACDGEPIFGEYEGNHYCVLHFPDAEKNEAFAAAIKKKKKANDYNYRGVWFPNGKWFNDDHIQKVANFTSATFNNISFRRTTFIEGAIFDHATFREANFSSAMFGGTAGFTRATFNGRANFDQASFNKSDFSEANFQSEANFRKTSFSKDVTFWRCNFVKRVDFDEAEFKAHASFWPTIFGSTAWFRAANFNSANFGGSRFADEAVFSWCKFGSALFVGAEFNKKAKFFSAIFNTTAYFTSSKFEEAAEFQLATFNGDTLFISTKFSEKADFWNATFKDYVKFSAMKGKGGFSDSTSCSFVQARFEKPERVSFHTILLRPHWFLNVDPRKFEFVDVNWVGNLSRDLIESEIVELRKREELEEREQLSRKEERRRNAELMEDRFTLEEMAKEEAEEIQLNQPDKQKESYHRLLSITCRHLAVNAEETHRYDEASEFRFWSMELRRKEGWRARGRLSVSILHTLYRHLSGYGEEIGRAFFILLGIWIIFAVLYTQVGFVRSPSLSSDVEYVADGESLKLDKAIGYSLGVIVLQRPDPKPLTSAANFAVLAETVLGPIQAALFALAVRRRFMR